MSFERVGTRFRTSCKCGKNVEVIQDSSNEDKFYYECHTCGRSETLTRTEDPSQEIVAPYRFDWTTNPPTTDDPRYSGRLSIGQHNYVWVDGEEFRGASPDKSPTILQTGKEGWVLVYDVDEKGMHREVAGVLLKKKIYGNVVYKDDRID